MSESNNVKKNKSSISFIIIIIYIVISIIVTSYTKYFYKKNNISVFKYYSYKLFGNKAIENEDTELIDTIKFIDNDKQIDRVSLSDRYWINNITFNEIKDIRGDSNFISDDGNNIETSIYILYYQIDGLKNKDIQDRINEDIKKHVYDELDEVNEYIQKNGDEEINSIFIDTYLEGSYSDILSFSINKSVEFKNDEMNSEDDKNFLDEITCLNYRLDTGEQFSFADCFTKDANIKNILSKTYYKQRAWYYIDEVEALESISEEDYKTVDENGNEIYGINMDKRDYGLIEDDLLKLMYYYNKNKDSISFVVTDRDLEVLYENSFIFIPMYDYYEYIDIAKKYVSDESLYENGNLDKENYMYSIPIICTFEYFDYTSSNVFLAVQNQEMMWKDCYIINKAENNNYNETDDTENNDYYNQEKNNKLDENEIDELISRIKTYLNENETPENGKGYAYYIQICKDYRHILTDNGYYEYVELDNYYFRVARLEIDNDNFKEDVENINYQIFNNSSEGYFGVYNLDEETLKKLNLQEYQIKEDENGNFTIQYDEL